MATAEYLLRFIEAKKAYDDLPERLKLAIAKDEWSNTVKTYCMHRGLAWAGSPAAAISLEQEYYEFLLQYYRSQRRLFPYHLGEYVCRVLRVTPFRYYRDILADAMRADQPYDAVPNFVAADALRTVGVGRNDYIAILNAAKAKKLLWRVNRGIVKDLLPQVPSRPTPAPWWRVNLVNVTETEWRSLDPAEITACQKIAACMHGIDYDSLEPEAFYSLYRRGLVWLSVPVEAGDALSIPPLEGFVSNKTSQTGQEADPLEGLMYQVFVAASDRVTVAHLAGILGVGVDALQVAISLACRLGFCRKLTVHDVDRAHATSSSSMLQSPTTAAASHEMQGLAWQGSDTGSACVSQPHASDLDAVLRAAPASPPENALPLTPLPPSQDFSAEQQAPSSPTAAAAVALVVDSEATGTLMMGALTPEVKKHSVTLFEGGRVYGEAVMRELINGLRASEEASAAFEGEMAALAEVAASLACALEMIQRGAAGRSIELLRKESLESLALNAAARILAHSYSIVLPVAAMPGPPLPLSPHRPGPTNYGPLAAAASPWIQLALYSLGGSGPVSLVLPMGRRLSRLPVQLQTCKSALAWPWDAKAARMRPAQPCLLLAPTLLLVLNHLMAKTPLLVQPLDGFADFNLDRDIVDIPLPLRIWQQTGTKGDDIPETRSDDPQCKAKNDSSVHRTVEGFVADGTSKPVALPLGTSRAIQRLGLQGAIGTLRVLNVGSEEALPLSISLGLPLQPTELCKAVCDAASAYGSLSTEACARHSAGQSVLQAVLDDLMCRYASEQQSTCGDVFVPQPAHVVLVDHHGQFTVIKTLGEAGQGLNLGG